LAALLAGSDRPVDLRGRRDCRRCQHRQTASAAIDPHAGLKQPGVQRRRVVRNRPVFWVPIGLLWPEETRSVYHGNPNGRIEAESDGQNLCPVKHAALL
jgi:hypothetical protein